MTLSDLHAGERVRITGFSAESDYIAELQRLGLVPGTELTVQRKAPLGDPIEVRVRGYSLALRPSEANELLIEVIDQ